MVMPNESNLIMLPRIYCKVYKKGDESEIALCFVKRLNVRCFFIKLDSFGTYNLE